MAGLLDFLSGNAGSIVGGLLGAASGSSSTPTTQTASRDPWGAAQPYMLQNLQNEAALQTQLQKTPFNTQQIQGYSNLFGDTSNFRDNVMPGLVDFANKGMSSSYQRQSGGVVGSGGGYGGAVRPGGMVQNGSTGAFSVAQGAGTRSNGTNSLLDLNGAQNPYTNGAITTPQTAQTATTSAPSSIMGGLLGNTGGGSNTGQDGSSYGGIGTGYMSDAISAQAADIAKQFGLASPIAGLVAGLVSQGMSTAQALASVNATDDPLGALATMQGWFSGPMGSESVGSNADSDGSEGSTNPGGGGISGYGGGVY